MIKRYIRYYSLQFLLSLVLSHTLSANDTLNKQESFSLFNPPRFEKYSIQEIYKGKIAPVNLKSYPEARKYRTRLREGAQTGPNFAGHYTIITIGCGTNCQNQWIVDAKTGKVLARFLTSFNLAYRLDSNLLILNPPTDELKELYKNHPEAPIWRGTTTYLIWEKDTPKTLYQNDLVKFLNPPNDS